MELKEQEIHFPVRFWDTYRWLAFIEAFDEFVKCFPLGSLSF